MSDDYKRYRESVELYPVTRVNPVVPISKNKRKTPEKVLPKNKDGLFSSLMDEETQPSKKQRSWETKMNPFFLFRYDDTISRAFASK